jgi:hypothetical protein
VKRLRDAARLAGALVAGVVSRHPVRPLGDETQRPLPGDELLPSAKFGWTYGITIRARPTEIWPWLMQMGCRRAGWYSYDGLDNGGVPSADRIVPELQRVEVGDVFPSEPTVEDSFVVRAVEPERVLVLDADAPPVTWGFVLEPIDETSTRLIARMRGDATPILGLLWHPIHFGMQRRQLLNLKRRVEAAR